MMFTDPLRINRCAQVVAYSSHSSESHHIEFHEVLGFWDFYGILGFKVKMHHFEQPASRRVVRKSVECCDFC